MQAVTGIFRKKFLSIEHRSVDLDLFLQRRVHNIEELVSRFWRVPPLDASKKPNNVWDSTIKTVRIVTHQSVHQPQASPVAVSTQQAALAAIGQSDVLQLSGTPKPSR